MRIDKKNEPNYWVVASGDSNHDYSDVFLDFGIMAIGPGQLGDYNQNKRKYQKEVNRKYLSSISLISDNKRIKKGIDFVVLRSGTSTIVAIGKIKSGYKWSKVLEDVYGWHLQHYREVDWKWVSEDLNKNYLFGYSDNLCTLSEKKVGYINNKIGFDYIRKKRCTLPKEMPNRIKHNKLNKYLKKRVFNKLIERIEIFDENNSTEQDIVTFLVVPLLEELGWRCEDITLNEPIGKGSGFVDVVLRKGDKPFCIIEVKYLGQGLAENVREQALDYVNGFRKKQKEKFPYFLLTDGKHYYLYKFINPNLPSAYINIDKKKLYQYHPLFRKTKGALDFLKIMER